MIPLEWITQADVRIRPHIHETPLTYDPDLDIFLKWENLQITGSFKARGALNKVLSIQNWQLDRGIVTASAGNHGQGVALAASKVNAKAVVFASDHAVAQKVTAMRSLGAEVRLVAGGYADAELAGLEYASETGGIWISPYNDGTVIAGQGTLAHEIRSQNPMLDRGEWIVPVGGGGLISGIGSYLSARSPEATLTGVQSEASPYFHAILYTGSQDNIIELPSLGDGLAGPVEKGSITIPIVRQTVSRIILVSENEIEAAIVYAWQHYHQIIEGSGAVSLAAVLTGKVQKRPAVILLSGGNIQPEYHEQLLIKYTDDESPEESDRYYTG